VKFNGQGVANKEIASMIQDEISDLAVNVNPLDQATNILKSAKARGISGEQFDKIQQMLIKKAVKRGATDTEIQSIINITSG
jgi:hypothetical protein